MATYNPYSIFQALEKNNIIQSDINKVDIYPPKQLNLGKQVPYQKWNYYDLQYGHPLNLHNPNPYLRPPNLDKARPPATLLEQTDNMLVDVAGVYYKNKDLKISPFKHFG